MCKTHIEGNSFSLYKVLPEQYVASLLDGKILFRNLVYFISREGDPRIDLYEGRHVDAPDHPVSLFFENGLQVSDYLEFHNSAKYPERIFCFCTSMRHGPEHAKFGSACVKFNNPAAFRKRLNAALVLGIGFPGLSTHFLLQSRCFITKQQNLHQRVWMLPILGNYRLQSGHLILMKQNFASCLPREVDMILNERLSLRNIAYRKKLRTGQKHK